jgi:hypothetical protein
LDTFGQINDIEKKLNELEYETTYEFALDIRVRLQELMQVGSQLPELKENPMVATNLTVQFNTLYKNEKLEQKEIFISKPPALKRSLTAPSDTDQAKVIQ